MLSGQKGGSLKAMAVSRSVAERAVGTFSAFLRTAGSLGTVITYVNCAIKILLKIQ